MYSRYVQKTNLKYVEDSGAAWKILRREFGLNDEELVQLFEGNLSQIFFIHPILLDVLDYYDFEDLEKIIINLCTYMHNHNSHREIDVKCLGSRMSDYMKCNTCVGRDHCYIIENYLCIRAVCEEDTHPYSRSITLDYALRHSTPKILDYLWDRGTIQESNFTISSLCLYKIENLIWFDEKGAIFKYNLKGPINDFHLVYASNPNFIYWLNKLDYKKTKKDLIATLNSIEGYHYVATLEVYMQFSSFSNAREMEVELPRAGISANWMMIVLRRYGFVRFRVGKNDVRECCSIV